MLNDFLRDLGGALFEAFEYVALVVCAIVGPIVLAFVAWLWDRNRRKKKNATEPV